MANEDEDYYSDAEECWDCGFVDYGCELCGYHGHDCPGGAEGDWMRQPFET